MESILIKDFLDLRCYYNIGVYYGAIVGSDNYRPEILIKTVNKIPWLAFKHLQDILRFKDLLKSEGSNAGYPLATNSDWSLLKNYHQVACAIAAGNTKLYSIFKVQYILPIDFGPPWLSNFTDQEVNLIKRDYDLMIAAVNSE